MPARATWKGTIKLSLVSIPIRVFPATNAASDVMFRQLHRKCLTPIQLKKWCPHCQEDVPADAIVKGSETAKGRYAVVEEADIAALRPDSTHTVDLSHVLHETTVDPVYIERTYYLTPDGKAAGGSFAVLREALRDRTAVGRVAIHGREYLVAVRPEERAMAMFTLRTSGEVRSLSETDGLEFAAATAKADEVKLARQLLDHLETTRDLSGFTDHYQQSLRQMLAQKADVPSASEAKGRPAARVVDLMSALRQSLERVEKGQGARKRSRHTIGKPAAAKVLRHPGASRPRRRKAS
jgi:DNA end-binding protein Ku